MISAWIHGLKHINIYIYIFIHTFNLSWLMLPRFVSSFWSSVGTNKTTISPGMTIVALGVATCCLEPFIETRPVFWAFWAFVEVISTHQKSTDWDFTMILIDLPLTFWLLLPLHSFVSWIDGMNGGNQCLHIFWHGFRRGSGMFFLQAITVYRFWICTKLCFFVLVRMS